MAAHTEAASFSDLDPRVQKLEFKVTVLPAEESKVYALLGNTGSKPVGRKVYFFDTPGLALADEHLFLRARITDDDDDDSTVKLRPLGLPDIPARWAATDDVKIEVDVVGAKLIDSAKLDRKLIEPGRIEQVAGKELKVGKLFNKDQEGLVGASLDDLAVLGPIHARKWDLPREVFPHDLSVEEWSVPDGPKFIELSFKVEPADAETAQQAFHGLLDSEGIGHAGNPEPKTRQVLEILAARVR